MESNQIEKPERKKKKRTKINRNATLRLSSLWPCGFANEKKKLAKTEFEANMCVA